MNAFPMEIRSPPRLMLPAAARHARQNAAAASAEEILHHIADNLLSEVDGEASRLIQDLQTQVSPKL